MTPTPKTVSPTLAEIQTNILNFTPAVLAGVQAAEVSGADSQTKLQAVVNGVIATSGALAGSNVNPNVAVISGLVNLFVSILNATGVFNHKAK